MVSDQLIESLYMLQRSTSTSPSRRRPTPTTRWPLRTSTSGSVSTGPSHRAPSSSSTRAGRSSEAPATSAQNPSWTRTSWATPSTRTCSACYPSWCPSSLASPGPASLKVSGDHIQVCAYVLHKKQLIHVSNQSLKLRRHLLVRYVCLFKINIDHYTGSRKWLV